MRKLLSTCCLLLALINFANSTRAEVRFSTSVKDLLSLQQNSDFQTYKLGGNRDLDKIIKFVGRIPGAGRYVGSFNSEKKIKVPVGKPSFLQGKSLRSSSNKTEPSFATVELDENGLPKLRLFIFTNHYRSSKRRLVEVNIKFKKDSKGNIKSLSKIVSRTPAKLRKACANDAKGFKASSDFHTSAIFRSIKLLVEADSAYAAKYPNYATQVATMINGMDTIYKRDLGLTFEANLNPSAVSYDSNIELDENYSYPIHREMLVKHPGAERDVHLLFTSKVPTDSRLENLAGAVPGIGVLCANPDINTAFVISFDTNFDLLTAAHEIGHLIGGEHDDNQTTSSNPGIMNSGTQATTGEITKFSDFSKTQISSYLAQGGTCLGYKEGSDVVDSPPPTTPTTPAVPPSNSYSIYSSKASGSLYGYVYLGETPVPKVKVNVLFSATKTGKFKKQKTLTTNDLGLATFKPKKSGFYKIQQGSQETAAIKFTVKKK